MKSILEKIMIKKYANPEIVTSPVYIEHWWNKNNEAKSSVLYIDYKINESEILKNRKYQRIYGKYCGGFIVGDSLKIANLSDIDIYGLYQIKELQTQPEVLKALKHNPDVTYFMDASNVWFYGFRGDMLFVYDAEMDEFDELGEIESAIETVIEEWENAAK